jgi:hypothetical protein
MGQSPLKWPAPSPSLSSIGLVCSPCREVHPALGNNSASRSPSFTPASTATSPECSMSWREVAVGSAQEYSYAVARVNTSCGDAAQADGHWLMLADHCSVRISTSWETKLAKCFSACRDCVSDQYPHAQGQCTADAGQPNKASQPVKQLASKCPEDRAIEHKRH